jgi:hypothetical protein
MFKFKLAESIMQWEENLSLPKTGKMRVLRTRSSCSKSHSKSISRNMVSALSKYAVAVMPLSSLYLLCSSSRRFPTSIYIRDRSGRAPSRSPFLMDLSIMSINV